MGLDEFFTKAVRDRKFQQAALEVASSCASATPVIKIVQAANKISKVGDVIQHANDFLSSANQTIKGAQTILPQMHILGKSLVDSTKLFHQFSMVATTLGMGANVIQTYQGIQALNLIAAKLGDISNSLEAQAALTAQRDFPQYVFDMIRERLSQTSVDSERDHWFFLYHPDTDWYPKFFHLIEEKPLSPRFCGYTNQLDTVFMFMLAARERIKKREAVKARRKQYCRPVQLHLIVPAYQTILIPEPFEIPEDIGDFVIEGRINSNRPFVWLNLPEEQQHYTFDVGMWSLPPPGIWQKTLDWLGMSDRPKIPDTRRTLGIGEKLELIEDEKREMTIQTIQEDGSMEVVQRAATESTMDLAAVNKQQSMPLHQGRRRRRLRKVIES
ncbi:hypothetical protein F53441_10497 [Fusarium austroafricanum]|uniref:Uncharacterized protein n=1 Tax=Fusarium austroafricanum TaxID=2364996 RepID=A0A8H4KA75_9HYPO|nr:hypothetical protein F53441_10497 [Fusarium austroafricanum]